MYTKDDYLDKVHIEAMDIIGQNYTGTAQKASMVAEQITLMVEELVEEEFLGEIEDED